MMPSMPATKQRPSVPGDTSAWLTKSEAAAALNIGEKTIERYAAKGKIQQSWRRVEGRRPIAVYNPADIEALKAEHFQAEFVMPEEKNGLAVQTQRQQPGNGKPSMDMERFFGAMAAAVQIPARKEKLFLTLEEAAEFSGLPQAYLTRAIKSGELPAIKSGKVFIRRRDLEKF